VEPSALTRGWLNRHQLATGVEKVLVVGAGKAAAGMAAGCERALDARRIGGMVIVPEGCEVPLSSVGVRVAGHPLPDERGAVATAELCRLLAASECGPVLCLISGGASSLMIEPLPPLTMVEKMAVNRLLLACGADIGEVNTVRKHLSAVKGGGLLRRTRARPIMTLVLSDVVGDDPSVIGSGPTTADPSTFADALAIVGKYRIADRIAPAARDLLNRGARGDLAETVKPSDQETAGAESIIIGSNRLALTAAAEEARHLGYEPMVDATPLVGETRQRARQWLADVRPGVEGRRRCAIAGGETTVTVRGAGRGGRNQEFALALAGPLAGSAVAVLSAGTDGIDGPTDAAGAFVDGETLARARAKGLDPAAALEQNDSYRFFDRLGDLLRCGPTGTNVMDIKLAVGLPSAG
jgi:hydroxypyruvate reductase